MSLFLTGKIQWKISVLNSHFIKVTSLQPTNLLKKRLPAQEFSCEFCKTYQSNLFLEHLRAAASVCCIPAVNYVFKVSNRNTRTRSEICSKLTIKTPERYHWRRSDFFIVNFEHISHHVLLFLLLTLSR